MKTLNTLAISAIILVFLSGCGLFLTKEVPREVINNIHSVKVVAMEAQPLIVQPGMAGMILPNVPIPDPSSIQSIRAAHVGFTVLTLIQLPELNKQAGAISKAMDETLFKGSHWEPTEVLAKSVAELLKTSGLYEVRLAPGVKPMPGVTSREYSLFMSDWSIPTNRWLRSDSEVYNLKSDSKTDVVIEVTMMNYELSADHIFMSVVTKLVDESMGSDSIDLDILIVFK